MYPHTYIHVYILMYIHRREVNNFNGLMEVISALHSAPVFRLHKTWGLVPKKLMLQYQTVAVYVVETRGSYKNYREAVRNAVPPLVPYVCVCIWI